MCPHSPLDGKTPDEAYFNHPISKAAAALPSWKTAQEALGTRLDQQAQFCFAERQFNSMKNLTYSLFIMLILIGCGFSPAYQKGSDTQKFLEQIYFSEPKGEADFLFLNAIEAKIQNRKNSKYLVNYSIAVSDSTISATRGTLYGKVNFTVKSVSDNIPIFDGSVSNFAGYTFLSRSSALIADIDSRNAALARLMNLLADSMRTRLIILGDSIE